MTRSLAIAALAAAACAGPVGARAHASPVATDPPDHYDALQRADELFSREDEPGAESVYASDAELSGGPMVPRRKLFASRIPGAPPAPLYLSDVGELLLVQAAAGWSHGLSPVPSGVRQGGRDPRAFLSQADGDPHRLRFRPDTTLYALIGRNTFSAAGKFAVDLERFSEVVFAGEPSGAKPNTFGDESPTTLPFSGLEGKSPIR